MTRCRLIPVLLLRNAGLYKTMKFKDARYVGDPINSVRIFNEKEVDEMIFLDIEATNANREPDYKTLKEIATECFMPLCYGGGVREVEQIEQVLKTGVERVAVNTSLVRNPDFVRQAAKSFGSSTIVASIDFRRNFRGRPVVYVCSGRVNTGMGLVEASQRAQDLGVGEVLLNSIDRDGTMTGYDVDAIRKASAALSIPVIACGGGGSLQDFRIVVNEAGASAAAAGAIFVFYGRHRAVLINYPSQQQLESISGH